MQAESIPVSKSGAHTRPGIARRSRLASGPGGLQKNANFNSAQASGAVKDTKIDRRIGGVKKRESQSHNVEIRCLLCKSPANPVAVGDLSSKVGAGGWSAGNQEIEIERPCISRDCRSPYIVSGNLAAAQGV